MSDSGPNTISYEAYPQLKAKILDSGLLNTPVFPLPTRLEWHGRNAPFHRCWFVRIHWSRQN